MSTNDQLEEFGDWGFQADCSVTEFFRTPLSNIFVRQQSQAPEGYFRFGSAVCFGRSKNGSTCYRSQTELHDTVREARMFDGSIVFPFDLSEVIDNFRCERYVAGAQRPRLPLADIYYCVRPMLPTIVRSHLQRLWLSNWQTIAFPSWPVETAVEDVVEQALILALQASGRDELPFIWFWPDGHASCAIVTHDVETVAGRNFCPALMELDGQYGVKGSYQFVPEHRYSIPDEVLNHVRADGCEVNVHDLNHDGRLFRDHSSFKHRAAVINRYLKKWGAGGFRAAVLYRNQDWYQELKCEYDMSVPNVGHLEAQRGGCCTVFPYFIGNILELPLTTTQDYAMFHYLHEWSTAEWMRQMDLIRAKNGLITVLSHPDYLMDPRAREVYTALLAELARLRDSEHMWVTLPSEVNRWWRARARMRIVADQNSWVIKGPQCERARLAYARVQNGRLTYTRNTLAVKNRLEPLPTVALEGAYAHPNRNA